MSTCHSIFRKRRSVRSFTDKPLDEKDLQIILEAGTYAPSGGNSQTTHRIVITNRAVLTKLEALVRQEFAKMEVTKNTYKSDLSQCPSISGNGNKNDLMGTINTIINVIIGVIGFVAVVVIILGGVQYTTSAGDPGKVKKAKDTILYGIIGLVVAILAYAIVNFVLSRFFQ